MGLLKCMHADPDSGRAWEKSLRFQAISPNWEIRQDINCFNDYSSGMENDSSRTQKGVVAVSRR